MSLDTLRYKVDQLEQDYKQKMFDLEEENKQLRILANKWVPEWVRKKTPE